MTSPPPPPPPRVTLSLRLPCMAALALTRTEDHADVRVCGLPAHKLVLATAFCPELKVISYYLSATQS